MLINDDNQSLLWTSFLAPRGESAMLRATRLGWASLSNPYDTGQYLAMENNKHDELLKTKSANVAGW